MHDLDRTYLEDTEGLEHADGEYGDHGEDEEGEGDGHGEDEDREAQGHEGGEIFHEDEVTEMAAELLGLSGEQELDHFLGDFLRKAGDLAGKFLSSSQGKALGGILKGVAVPALANAIAPGAGGAMASALGFELEGLSPEDQEFEAAKQFIRLGAEAVRQAAGAPQGVDPRAVAETAMTRAAQQFAPGLLHGALPEGAPALPAESGRWTRRGHHIILHGVY
jgi:hypothetical protein